MKPGLARVSSAGNLNFRLTDAKKALLRDKAQQQATSARAAKCRSGIHSKFMKKAMQSQFPGSDNSEDLSVTKHSTESTARDIPSRLNKRWKFAAKNTDIVKKKSVVEKWQEGTYKNYVDVPTVDEITNALFFEQRIKSEILNERKVNFQSLEVERTKKMEAVVKRELLAKKTADSRLKDGKSTLSELIKILRLEPELRSGEQLLVLLDWMNIKCPQNALVYRFLEDSNHEESLEFCRGLKYVIFEFSFLLFLLMLCLKMLCW